VTRWHASKDHALLQANARNNDDLVRALVSDAVQQADAAGSPLALPTAAPPYGSS
jgi:hypothetical protein